jgi:hypothetical protein
MANNLKFSNLYDLDEVRKPKKCPIFDFGPLRESVTYGDLISLGYVEVNAQGEPRLENETFQGERQGNLRFKHPRFRLSIRMNLNGAIWEDAPSGRAYRINIEWDHDPKWYKACLGLDDYENRLQYLIKKLLHADGFITGKELTTVESGTEVILRKIDENIENIKRLRTVPPSLEKNVEYLKVAAEYGLF